MATCAFRHPDEFWPEREDERTHLHVLWTDDTRLLHGVIRRPDPDSWRLAAWLSQEVWATGLRLPTHQLRATPAARAVSGEVGRWSCCSS